MNIVDKGKSRTKSKTGMRNEEYLKRWSGTLINLTTIGERSKKYIELWSMISAFNDLKWKGYISKIKPVNDIIEVNCARLPNSKSETNRTTINGMPIIHPLRIIKQ